ncbi:hypothetical protein [Amycolatopsis speibonae]|uniref:Uncharacterized protein n=1 Tax=Amycolatopsis speibonae TaxID=1450224 RepID=A0ABV7PCX4_9PSEU
MIVVVDRHTGHRNRARSGTGADITDMNDPPVGGRVGTPSTPRLPGHEDLTGDIEIIFEREHDEWVSANAVQPVAAQKPCEHAKAY